MRATPPASLPIPLASLAGCQRTTTTRPWRSGYRFIPIKRDPLGGTHEGTASVQVLMRPSVHGTLCAICSILAACQPGGPRESEEGVVAGRPAVIPLVAGEKGWLDSSGFILLKVDPKLVGSEHFGLGSEDMPPRSAIPFHRHVDTEELLIVQRGHAAVMLSDSAYDAGAGGVVHIPRDTWVGVANHGPDTLTVFFIFPTPATLSHLYAKPHITSARWSHPVGRRVCTPQSSVQD
jgi:quercetin dioxygenase-like cupin family protein